jgi:hypothetical protein
MKHRFFAWFLAVALPAGLLVAIAAPAFAAPEPQRRGDIFISSNKDFDKDHGIRWGKGTRKDPYVIANWDVSSIVIKDTSKFLEIRDNVVSNQLVLDWNGDRLNVHHNAVSDLRVNQNVERTGEQSSGRIHHNTFGIVGQLRHWDGAFENNKIGTQDLLQGKGVFKAMQLDGFHGSQVRNNTIFGYVDVKLHGHHHGSGFKKESHYHGSPEGYDHHGSHQHSVDHSRRYHQIMIKNNTITSDNTYSLRYYDRDHTADDRTNASETNKFLNCPHVHFTKVAIQGNNLKGGGLVIDVFNAFDENHWETKRGRVDIKNNRISLDRDHQDLLFARNGITVQEAVDVDVHIVGNRVFGPDMVAENDILNLEGKVANFGAGIALRIIDQARIYVKDNLVSHRDVGVSALQFTSSVRWWVKNLKTADVEKKVERDGSARPPQ